MIALLKKHSVLAGNIGLVLVMLLGLAYLTFGSLGWRPLAKTYGLTVELPNSGGIQTTSDVYLRGARIDPSLWTSASVGNAQIELMQAVAYASAHGLVVDMK